MVVAIIGILFGLGIGGLDLEGNQDAAVKREAQRLNIVAELARDEAIVQSSEYGLQLFTNGYRWFQLVDMSVTDQQGNNKTVQVWQPTEQTDVQLSEHQLGEEISLLANINGLEADLATLEGDGFPEVDPLLPPNDKDAQRPGLFALSSGEMSEFEIVFSHPFAAVDYVVTGNMLGTVEYSMRAKPEDDF